ncbi:DUF2442 domain-containing protein [Halorhodospira halophila]|uniref:DUF2442 domain-containing protein n=1 Tax=Halorhodospira halophila TaxID=1053 RepID=UPI003207D1A0|nr:hypothetical protein [Halorhodospira halophila]
MPYEEFSWFKGQPVKSILHVEEPSPGHYYWPDIDVDLTDGIIEAPSRIVWVSAACSGVAVRRRDPICCASAS